MDEIRILSPTAILGYGFPLSSFAKGMERNPHIIAVDAGSTDPGPYYLGSGTSFTDREAVKRDLAVMLKAGKENKIPVLVGTAGGSGADSHLNWCLEIVREIVSEEKLNLKMATISSQIDKGFLIRELDKGNITVLGYGEELTKKDIEETTNIVAQMGVEPFIKALKKEQMLCRARL